MLDSAAVVGHFGAGLVIGALIGAVIFIGIILRTLKPIGWVVVIGIAALLLWNL